MKLFYLERTIDPSGVSGLGRVAEGVIFTSGKVALTWTCGTPSSVAIYETIEHVETIHGHNGTTKVIMENLCQ